MIRWTLKSLLAQPVAFIGSVAAISAAFLLILAFQAIWNGEADQAVNYVRHAGADVWVMQKGVSNMHMATSLIRDWKEESVAAVDGVAGVVPIRYGAGIIHTGGRDWITFLVGLKPGSPFGGPWAMAAGRPTPAPGEVVIPATMAALSGVTLGQDVRISDKQYRVVGLSEGTFSMGNPVAFLTETDIAEMFSTYGYVSYLLVQAAPHVTPKALAAKIHREVEDVEALPSRQFIRNDYGMVMQMGIELIGLMTGISATLAALLIAFTLYVHTIHQRRQLGVLKALGFRKRELYLGVAAQAVLLSVTSFVVAVLMAYGVAWLTSQLAPQITMRVTGDAIVQVAVGGVLVALAATLAPVWQIARVDPQTVFQS